MPKTTKADLRAQAQNLFPGLIKDAEAHGMDPHLVKLALMNAASVIAEREPINDLTDEEVTAIRAWIAARRAAIHRE